MIPEVCARWRGAPVTTLTVPPVTLDEAAAARGLVPDLVKIDTEGAELAVLRGARRLRDTARPTVVFESWPCPEQRRATWALLAEHGYAIAAVDGAPPRALTRPAFVGAHPTNFVAEVPPGRVIHSARR